MIESKNDSFDSTQQKSEHSPKNSKSTSENESSESESSADDSKKSSSADDSSNELHLDSIQDTIMGSPKSNGQITPEPKPYYIDPLTKDTYMREHLVDEVKKLLKSHQHGPPFTIQRFAELLLDPSMQYSRNNEPKYLMGLIRVLNVASNTSDFENIDLKALSQERELEIKVREAQDELGYDDDEEEADEGSNTFIFSTSAILPGSDSESTDSDSNKSHNSSDFNSRTSSTEGNIFSNSENSEDKDMTNDDDDSLDTLNASKNEGNTSSIPRRSRSLTPLSKSTENSSTLEHLDSVVVMSPISWINQTGNGSSVNEFEELQDDIKDEEFIQQETQHHDQQSHEDDTRDKELKQNDEQNGESDSDKTISENADSRFQNDESRDSQSDSDTEMPDIADFSPPRDENKSEKPQNNDELEPNKTTEKDNEIDVDVSKDAQVGTEKNDEKRVETKEDREGVTTDSSERPTESAENQHKDSEDGVNAVTGPQDSGADENATGGGLDSSQDKQINSKPEADTESLSRDVGTNESLAKETAAEENNLAGNTQDDTQKVIDGADSTQSHSSLETKSSSPPLPDNITSSSTDNLSPKPSELLSSSPEKETSPQRKEFLQEGQKRRRLSEVEPVEEKAE